eukprot:265917-Chlamydomonas_euryale.AAC.1
MHTDATPPRPHPDHAQVLVALGTIIVALLLQLVMDPYRLHRMEALERLSLYGNTALLYISMYFVITNASEGMQCLRLRIHSLWPVSCTGGAVVDSGHCQRSCGDLSGGADCARVP